MKERFSLTLDSEVMKKFDKIRGICPRSTFTNFVLEGFIDAFDKESNGKYETYLQLHLCNKEMK